VRPDLLAGLEAVAASPFLGVAITLAAWEGAKVVQRRAGGHPLANPVLVAIVTTLLVLALPRISYAQYATGADLLGLLLGPATVALAVPIHRQLPRIRAAALPLAAGLLCGCVTGIVSAVALTVALAGSPELAMSMAPKSTTAPVAIALAERLGGLPSLTAALTILTGILGAVVGPQVLTWLRIRGAAARGLAMGVASHGIGTARALSDDLETGAFSGLGMALNALTTAVVLPTLLASVPWLARMTGYP